MLGTELWEPFEDANLPFGAREPLTFPVDLLVIVGKAILETQIGIHIFPHVDGQIPARLRVVFDENCFTIGGIATKEMGPDAIAAVSKLKIRETILCDCKFPENVDHRAGATALPLLEHRSTRTPHR